MRENIKEKGIDNCFGCAVCAKACPQNIIVTKINSNGFFGPEITNTTKCVHCGLCLDVCAYCNEGLSHKEDCLTSFAGWSTNDDVREMCSSGGVGYELAKSALHGGYKVCAVRYNVGREVAEHYIASTIDELRASIGSKYVQSDTLSGMKDINPNEKYIIFGTPCHIDSFRRYIYRIKKEENFILVDFFCHGVPSYLLWWKYLAIQKAVVGQITKARWRDKKSGWHDSWVMAIKGSQGELYSKLSNKDLFLRAFLSDACLGQACYDKCKYKYTLSSADIRIGDAWGQLYKDDQAGVSAIVCYTEIGQALLNVSEIKLQRHSFGEIAEYQMKTNAKRPFIYNAVWQELKSERMLDVKRMERILALLECSLLPKRIVKKLKKMLDESCDF